MNIEQENLLIDQTKKDLKHFTTIYEEYVKDVYRYCYAIVNDKEKTEDIVSETFFKALKYIKTYTPQGKSIKCWLFTICRHEIYRNHRPPTENLDENMDIASYDEEILSEIIKEEQQQNIRALLNKLPSKVSEIIRLKIWEEMTFEEISEILKEPESTVKMAYYRGLTKLKEKVNDRTE